MNKMVERVLRDRRKSLLRAIPYSELLDMRRKLTGETHPYPNADVLRDIALVDWSVYAPEIERWCAFTLTGESTL